MKVTYTTPNGYTYGLFEQMLKQTHLLVAGATGSGKSVLCNGLITTLLYRLPLDVEGGCHLILIDPKGNELNQYKNLPHTIGYAVEQDDILRLLQYASDLMRRRYKIMSEQGKKIYSGSRVVILIEELADLMTTNRRAYQPLIQHICQMGRAANMMVIAQTQCPIVKVIPTEIKCNFTGIVALRTRNAQDSRNIIGEKGAEDLPEYGQCLYYCPAFLNTTYRFNVPYVTDEEQMALVRFWERQVIQQRQGLFGRLFRRNR